METNTEEKLTLIARIAKAEAKLKYTSLMHLLNAQYLLECYKQLKRGKAAGVDGKMAEDYSQDEVAKEITTVIEQIRRKRYHPKPVRRVYIKKTNGKMRALGIPTVIDKTMQVGIARILEAIYEPIFLNNSYGFRPKRSAHDALKETNHMIMREKVNWIVEVDIENFFDTINHAWMIKCLSQKISDPNFTFLINRFLKSGVMTDGKYIAREEGTPQGGNLSPILANIYLHYILDLWFEKREKLELKGYAKLIRYADDFIIGVQHQEDAVKLEEELKTRCNKFGLTLSKEKTKIIEFGRFAKENRERRKERKPNTFDFLGFTHYCTKTQDGRFMVKIKTSRIKLNKTITAMNQWLKRNRSHMPIKDIWQKLQSKLTGHYNYYGISGNFEGVNKYYHKTLALTFKWMNRKSQKKMFNWERFWKYLHSYPLPEPKLTYAIYNTW